MQEQGAESEEVREEKHVRRQEADGETTTLKASGGASGPPIISRLDPMLGRNQIRGQGKSEYREARHKGVPVKVLTDGSFQRQEEVSEE
eukprot:290986-Hanusia_phi.AAC.1